MAEIVPGTDWEAIRAAHRWVLPGGYNLADDIVGTWARAEPGRLALVHLPGDGAAPGDAARYSFGDLDRLSNRLANLLRAHGLRRGDRVAVCLAQSPEAMLTHLAAYKLGAIAVPLFTLFGPEALDYRLRQSGAAMLVTDLRSLEKIAPIRDGLPDLAAVLTVDGPGPGTLDMAAEMERASDAFAPVETGPETPAFISYTSGTTGPPKGALHPHRVLLGHLPGVQLAHEMFPQTGDMMWTPADWAWMGGLCNIAMPCLRFGVPLLSHRMERFDPERAFWLIERFGVRNVFLPPTALKLMRRVERPERFALGLRSVATGGESMGAELLDWGRAAFGLAINEFYGQTECNLVLGNCASVLEVLPGSMGKPYPGSEVAVLGEDGKPLPPGEAGEIAIRRGDAAMFLEYWRDPERTAQKFSGDWMLTGDEGVIDARGYFHFASRTDDVITSSGYRIGPTEIEHCLTGHEAVKMAAVIGVPDPVRTEIVRAYVTLAPGVEGSQALAEALIAHVKQRLSPHLAPRELRFIAEMPITATGKIRRRDLREIG